MEEKMADFGGWGTGVPLKVGYLTINESGGTRRTTDMYT